LAEPITEAPGGAWNCAANCENIICSFSPRFHACVALNREMFWGSST
jgi:hypothetical protein